MYDVFSYSLKSCKSCVFSIVFRGFTVPTLKFNPWQLKNAPGHLLQDGFTLAEFVGSSTGGYGKKPIREQHMISRPDISKKTFCETSLKKPSHLFFFGGEFLVVMVMLFAFSNFGTTPPPTEMVEDLRGLLYNSWSTFCLGRKHPKSQRSQFLWDAFHPPKKNLP